MIGYQINIMIIMNLKLDKVIYVKGLLYYKRMPVHLPSLDGRVLVSMKVKLNSLINYSTECPYQSVHACSVYQVIGYCTENMLM